MCGIAGIISKNPAITEGISSMTAALRHRGPDDVGHFVQGDIALGHTRLSIIDIEGGHQPMSNHDSTLWITFNGEIYNYRDLRRELAGRGHRFKTNSDTETIICAYEEWKEDCVHHLRGMFAFAIADMREKKVFLARDHFGIKPLYYLQTPGVVAFASELQALKQVPGVKLNIDMEALDRYLWLRYIPDPFTIFREIKKLPPAHSLSVPFHAEPGKPARYWQIEFSPGHSGSREEWVERMDGVLRESIQAHMVSDVPFGAFLSGGVDSGALVAYMAQHSAKPVKTFSLGFEEDEFSELKYAGQVSAKWKTEHHTQVIKPEAMDILPELVSHYGEPFGDNSALPTYYLSKLARQHVPMVLSGDGADEAFAGYNAYRYWLEFIHLKGNPRESLSAGHWLRFKSSKLKEPIRMQLWRPEYRHLVNSRFHEFETLFEKGRGYSDVQHAQYMDLNSYLPFSILTKVDRASMCHGLEVRVPFVDVKVMEFAAMIPESLQIGKNAQGEYEGKLLLKNLMARYYPESFLRRPKMGFEMPIAKWFGKEGMLRPELRARLVGRESALLEYLDAGKITWLLDESEVTDAKDLWLLLFLEEWLRQNKECLV